MQLKPLIALPDTGTGLFHRYMIKKYETVLQRAGARVLWIRPAEVEKALACDGLVLPGGGDVNPKLYGAKKHSRTYGTSLHLHMPNVLKSHSDYNAEWQPLYTTLIRQNLSFPHGFCQKGLLLPRPCRQYVLRH